MFRTGCKARSVRRTGVAQKWRQPIALLVNLISGDRRHFGCGPTRWSARSSLVTLAARAALALATGRPAFVLVDRQLPRGEAGFQIIKPTLKRRSLLKLGDLRFQCGDFLLEMAVRHGNRPPIVSMNS